jgi:hypothetical protein
LTGIRLYYNAFAGLNLAAQNLSGARFIDTDLTGANLSHANLTGAGLAGTKLVSANLRQANLTNVNFAYTQDEYGNYLLVDLTDANLTGADLRGANFYDASNYPTLTGADTRNVIWWAGGIDGLDLLSGASLIVRDYDGDPSRSLPPIDILVSQHVLMDASSDLLMVFEADAWDSTISFAPGIPVTLGGTLDLTFAPGVDVATQSGRTIDLFDWTGVTPTGTFTVSSPYTWDLTDLYTTGDVTLTAAPSLPGDFNNDGTVDAADYVVWRKTDGTPAGYNTWRTHFGEPAGSGAGDSANATVPEPATFVMLMVTAAGVSARRRWRTF